MKSIHSHDESFLREVRIFLEETCCDLLRFQHVARDRVTPEDVDIDQEVFVGVPQSFADIRVKVPGQRPYFVEVKYGYPPETVVAHLGRKYGKLTPITRGASKVVAVLDSQHYPDWPAVKARARAAVHSRLKLEFCDMASFLAQVRRQFRIQIASFSEESLLDVRAALDNAKGRYAFGNSFSNEFLESSLLWHFGFWRLHQLRAKQLSPREIFPPGLYKGVAVVIADLTNFSSYLRDTKDEDVVRHVLTSFYTKARYQILNSGGMVYQFIGDSVLALFGVPERRRGYVDDALECAFGLMDIGNSVSNEWQRHIDHIQDAAGCHISMAIGDLHVLPMRPFGRARIGAIGDCINIAARLNIAAGPSEIVISNSFYQKLPEPFRRMFHEMKPLEARNIGHIRTWKYAVHPSPPQKIAKGAPHRG